ncbi:extracellular serine proteinase precursor [mine drainage metagenome]|uniref:Extracellular serine proteinase n=1 Tax=mine drainage metagenome TaxID=410659 RepID=A0A1J5QHG7_9ZZZZ
MPRFRARRVGWACAVLVVASPSGAALAADGGTAPSPSPSSGPTSTYVVEVKPGEAAAAAAAIDALGATPDKQFSHAVDGFSVDLTSTQADQLATAPEISAVTADQTFYATSTESPAPWGLDRLDQVNLPLDNRYTYPDSAGAGVSVYVVDTGVSPNPTFGNRLASGFTAYTDGYGTTDCNGHGTHVAGTVASTLYGVAKAATVVPVRVLNCSGSGSTSTVITGLDWIAAHHSVGSPGVVNMSMSGPLSTALNTAVAGLVADGLTVVVAAGNNDANSCSASPSSAPAALTVGATDQADMRASFSDWGPCLDLFAPGVSIVSLSATSPASNVTMSGTSMAAPHVAGIAALYLGVYPAATPDQVDAAVTGAAEHVVTGADATTTTDLASSNVLPVLGSVSGLRITAATTTSLTVAWDAPAAVAGVAAQSYQVAYRQAGAPWINAAPTVATTEMLSGLQPSTTYEIEVAATTAFGTGAPSGSLMGTTSIPASATSLYVTSVYSHLFQRAPDPSGLASWTSALDAGTPRSAVAYAITSSAEYRTRLIATSYRTYLNREPDPVGLQSWLGEMGRGMTVQAMEDGFVASAEFYANAGGTPDSWVRSLYATVLNRTAGPSEVAYWVGRLNGGFSRSAVAYGFLLSTEHLTSVIDGYYQDLLGRGIDPSGQATWVAAVQNGTRVEGVIGQIIASAEYYAKNT